MIAAPVILGLLFGIPASVTNRAYFENVNIGFQQYYGFINHPLIQEPKKTLDKQLDLQLGTNFFKVLYWQNSIIGQTEQERGYAGQFRTIAWDSKIGIRIAKSFEIELGHRSTHMIDGQFTHTDEPFYNEDYIGFRWYLHRTDFVHGLFDGGK